MSTNISRSLYNPNTKHVYARSMFLATPSSRPLRQKHVKNVDPPSSHPQPTTPQEMFQVRSNAFVMFPILRIFIQAIYGTTYIRNATHKNHTRKILIKTNLWIALIVIKKQSKRKQGHPDYTQPQQQQQHTHTHTHAHQIRKKESTIFSVFFFFLF